MQLLCDVVDRLQFAINSFAIFNPNDGTFAIVLENDASEELAQVEVFDIQGKKIYSTDLNKEQINYISIPQISKGMYFIKINLGQNLIYSDKIEVIR